MRLLKALAATIALLALVVVPPWALITFIGNPWPAEGISLSAPLTDGAIIGLLAVTVWVLWLQVMVCLVVEVVSVVTADRVQLRAPLTLGVQKQLARSLIAAVVMATVAGPIVVSASAVAADGIAQAPVNASPGISQTALPTVDRVSSPAEVREVGAVTTEAPRLAVTGPGSTVTVMRLDSLWSIAERVLGDGDRWTEIAELNEGKVMNDGATFMSADHIRPGWTLQVPAGAVQLDASQAHDEVETSYQVRAGDTLAGIADRELGDPQEYEAIFAASRDILQPGGGRLTDPHHIEPGWTVAIPAGGGANIASVGSEEDAPVQPTDEVAATGTELQPVEHNDDAVMGLELVSDLVQEVRETQGALAEPPEATSGEHATSQSDLVALRTLLGSALGLSAGVLALLTAQRRRQLRKRRLGHLLTPCPEHLVDVDQAISDFGSVALNDIQFLDLALRHLAWSCRMAREPIPSLGAAVLAHDTLTLLFAQPTTATAPQGWAAAPDAWSWSVPRARAQATSQAEQPAPYPGLVSVGRDEAGRTWLVDIEAVGLCGIGGDPEQAANLARFMVAEVAVNPWAEGAEVLLPDEFGTELVRLNPLRIRQVGRADALARTAAVAEDMGRSERNLGSDLLARRRDGILLDTAAPVILVSGERPYGSFVNEIERRDRSRVVVLHPGGVAPMVEVSGTGTAYLPMWAVTVSGLTMSARQAEPLADLVAAARALEDEPVPPMSYNDGPLGKYARVDGSLRDEYTRPRRPTGRDSSSILPDDDEVYLAASATTSQDLAMLAPSVPEEACAELAVLDPWLDEDLAAWFDEASPRPKVHVLGPVSLRALFGGDLAAIENAESTLSFIAYLAAQQHGVTPAAACAALGWGSEGTVQNRAANARYLLGARPDGGDWLRDPSMSTAAGQGGDPTYALDRGPGGVLSSADLFLRLRHRAERRGDAQCETDLIQALTLVTGSPFEAATPRHFAWVSQPGVPAQVEVLVGAIHDVAHVLAVRASASGRPDLVRFACEAARKASSGAHVVWLDEVVAVEAEFGHEAAARVVREHVLGQRDEELPARSEEVIERRRWGVAG